MKVIDLHVDRDEVWPVYDLSEPHSYKKSNCRIPEEIYKEYLRIEAEYKRMQTILEMYYEQS